MKVEEDSACILTLFMGCAVLGGEKNLQNKPLVCFAWCCLVIGASSWLCACGYRGHAGPHTWAAAGAVQDQSWHSTPHKTHIWKFNSWKESWRDNN